MATHQVVMDSATKESSVRAVLESASSTATAPALEALRASEVQLHIVGPREVQNPIVEAAYALWHEVWFATFRQLDGLTHLDSNEFARQDEILAFLYGGRCIAVSALRRIDRSTRVGREDSYFRPWPREALERAGNAFWISSNTAVVEDMRRARVALGDECRRLSEIVIALALRRFVASSYDQFVGVARNHRKMNAVGTSLGGRTIGRVVVHGEESDIVVFSRFGLPAFCPAVEMIWSGRSGRALEGGP